MGKRMHGTAAIVSAGLFALVGCQNFSGFSTSPAGNATSNFLPGMSSPNTDGSASVQISDGPKIKNMRGTSKEKVDASLAAAQAMESSGKHGEAAMFYEQVRQLDPRRDLYCARHLAVLYDRNGNFDKALDEYAKLLKANPKDAEAYNDLGYGYYNLGKFEAAETNLRKSVEFDPKSKRAWCNFGMALAQLGRYEESLVAFEKAVNRPQAHCNVAFIQAAQGKWSEARDSYALALKLEPGLQKARAALQRMDEPRNKTQERIEAKRRLRDIDRPPEIDPDFARNLPFGVPTGTVGASSDMIYISDIDQPINLPMPGSSSLPPARPNAAAANAAAGLPSLPPALPRSEPNSLPAVPSTALEVD